jgi:REP element-mobilizing transposase RayT
MARPLRIEYPGALYHVTSRGNARQAIYKDDADRLAFLKTLEAVVERFNWLCHAYCLMGNHYHLLIETPEGNLSKGMRELNGRYTQAFNRRHRRVGHLFQGRFKAILVERDSYLLELCRYVVLNPVRAKMVRAPGHYKWSSYRATAGQGQAPAFLTTDWILSQFAKRRTEARKRYRRFVRQGLGEPASWGELKGQVLLGTEAFVRRIARHLKGAEELKEIPRRQRLVNRPALSALFKAVSQDRSRRNRQIRRAHLKHGYSLTEIGEHLGLHYSTISKVVSVKGR